MDHQILATCFARLLVKMKAAMHGKRTLGKWMSKHGVSNVPRPPSQDL